MSIIGSIVKRGIQISNSVKFPKGSPFQQQQNTLRKLLEKARETKFGKAYKFDQILDAFDRDGSEFYSAYKKNVPIFTYNEMAKLWWNRNLKGEEDVAWPGKIKYFALSSGTSEASTKHIPITRDLIRANQKTSVRQILTLAYYKDLPTDVFTTGVLMLGGSTKLNNHGTYYDGDLSGIQASRIPTWFTNYYKPGKRISKISNWAEKLEEITLKAKDWNIGVIAGSPAWNLILIEKIIKHYNVKTIHDIWPNLTIFCFGGVSLEPYRKGFEAVVARPLLYLETYLASEGFIAYQAEPNRDMKLVLDNGLFLEFIPFNEENFTPDGDLVEKPKTYMVNQVQEGVDYALLMSTVAGAWRYMIGDVVRFSNVQKAEIKIVGRTKHYISLCGEHLSMENMDHGLSKVQEEMNITIKEYAVAGSNNGGNSEFTHHWYVGSDDTFDKEKALTLLDKELGVLNDDYAIERQGPLKHLKITVLPSAEFYRFMKEKLGKEGGQNKFPRVLKKVQLELWNSFLKENGLEKEVTE